MNTKDKTFQTLMANLTQNGIWFIKLEFILHERIYNHQPNLKILEKAVNEFIENNKDKKLFGDKEKYFKTCILENYQKIQAIESYRPKTIEEQMEQARKEVLKWKTFEDIDKWFEKWDFEPHNVVYSNPKIQVLYEQYQSKQDKKLGIDESWDI